MKYISANKAVPKDQRLNINSKIVYLITNNLVGQTNITPGNIYNSYTGNGGLHGLERKDFDNYHAYSEAKKDIEQGQFFTPHDICQFIVDCMKPSNTDIIYDLTFGMGNFFNFLPVERNIYGTELDVEAAKVAKYLYPNANLEHGDIVSYKPPVKADLVIGNPPFHLVFESDYGESNSHFYYCLKAAETLKPAGLMAVIMPKSFMNDDFFDKSTIEKMNDRFNFVAQLDLPSNAFKHLGVSSFETKFMVFQKRSRYIKDKPYAPCESTEIGSSEEFHSRFIAPLLAEKSAVAGKIYFESKNASCIDKDFAFKVTKLLFDIKRNPRICDKFGVCENYLNEYLNQRQPLKMPWAEWEKVRIKSEDVIKRLKKALASANKGYRNEKRIIKGNYDFYIKDYSENERHEHISSINSAVLDGRNVTGYEKLLDRKRNDYERQSQKFAEMDIDPQIADFLANWSVYSRINDETIRLNQIQAEDVNKLLQKNYGLLQYEQGSGKTVCSLAMAQYKLANTNVRNVYVVGPAIAISNTWEVVLEDYCIDFIRIHTLADIQKIKRGQIVIITLDMVVKYQRWLREYIRSQSQKVMLVFDESDSITNPYSSRTKAMLSVFRKCQHKYELTGTSTRNNICEIAPQLELLYNNSINYLSMCSYIYTVDKDNCITKKFNDNYGRPFPAYRSGYNLFSYSHLPKKITVFGIEQETQDIYNAGILSEILDRTIITKTFDEVVGRKIYSINQITVPFHEAERGVYLKATKEFHEIRYLYFAKMENSRKDSMFFLLQQLLMLLKVCADPAGIVGYNSDRLSSKVSAMLGKLNDWQHERVAIGVRHVSVLNAYAKQIQKAFPGRPLFIVTGSATSFKARREIVKELGKTANGILLCTQQSLSSSTNIDFVDKVLIPELHYNNSAMSQFYFRFIRYTSVNFKKVYFLTYANSIETNLLKMVMVKEKLNLFMKSNNIDYDELYEKFGIDPGIFNSLMSKGYDEDGKLYIRWGEQKVS